MILFIPKINTSLIAFGMNECVNVVNELGAPLWLNGKEHIFHLFARLHCFTRVG